VFEEQEGEDEDDIVVDRDFVIGNIPDGIEYLEMKHCMVAITKDAIPSTVKTLKMSNYDRRLRNSSLPVSLKNFIIDDKYRYEIIPEFFMSVDTKLTVVSL